MSVFNITHINNTCSAFWKQSTLIISNYSYIVYKKRYNFAQGFLEPIISYQKFSRPSMAMGNLIFFSITIEENHKRYNSNHKNYSRCSRQSSSIFHGINNL